MSLVFTGLALAAGLMASPQTIQPEHSAAQLSNGQANPRMLYICGRDEASKRAFKRQHGEVTFVSAKAVLASRTDGARWAAPRCITGAEFRRLQSLSDDLVYVNRDPR